jgi:alpha-glucosidase
VQQGDAASVLAHYRGALTFRRAHPALVSGAIEFLDAEDDVLAFIRSTDSERLLCLFNFAGESAEWAVPAELAQLQMLEASGQGARIEGMAVMLDPLSSCFAQLG